MRLNLIKFKFNNDNATFNIQLYSSVEYCYILTPTYNPLHFHIKCGNTAEY